MMNFCQQGLQRLRFCGRRLSKRTWRKGKKAKGQDGYAKHSSTVYAGLGEKDNVFEFLEKACQEKSSDLPYFLRADLRIDNLRSDPRFQDLLGHMNSRNK